MKDNDDQLIAVLARRNWLILAALVILSLLFEDKELTLGVVYGGLVAVGGYLWLYSSLVKVLSTGESAVKRFQFGYTFRLLALVGVLLMLIAVVKVNTLGLIIGLSVVVINIMLTTVLRVIK